MLNSAVADSVGSVLHSVMVLCAVDVVVVVVVVVVAVVTERRWGPLPTIALLRWLVGSILP